MDGYTISNFLSLDPYTNRYFEGFVMQDSEKFPNLNQIDQNNPGLYVMNTDRKGGRGEHWCVAFIYQGDDCRIAEFFDPYGLGLYAYNFQHLFASSSDYVVQSIKTVQGLFSKACGHHCLFYSFHRCRGFSLSDILKMYSNNLSQNEHMVINFLHQFGRHYKIIS